MRSTDTLCEEDGPSCITAISSSGRDPVEDETTLSFILQSTIPVLISGFILLLAGLFFNYASSQAFFTDVPVAVALVTPLLGLKGNVEMNFASRLATLAHQGRMQRHRGERKRIIGTNLVVVELQSIALAAASASTAVLVTTLIGTAVTDLTDLWIILGAATTTAALSSCFMLFLLIGIVLLARRFKLNPDNVLTPTTSAVGDLLTLLCFDGIGMLLQMERSATSHCLSGIALCFVWLLALIACLCYTTRCEQMDDALTWGWLTLSVAAMISSAGGYIVDKAVDKYKTILLFQPLLVGTTGNRCAVQCSRLSTEANYRMTQSSTLDKPPSTSLNPVKVFCARGKYSMSAWVSIGLAASANLVFHLTIIAIEDLRFDAVFSVCYVLASLVLTAVLMYVCSVVVQLLAALGFDPDNHAIPLMTS
ncbi:Solute carrier family 41 member 2 [Aphelenchoides avenae]|nr:Solute carrier family 41 member 2 [Aphelenchus avenae]